MPVKKSHFEKFVEIAACASLLIGIFTFIRGDVIAKTRVDVDVENLKQAAPRIEKRLDEIEKTQSAIFKMLEHIEKEVDSR